MLPRTRSARDYPHEMQATTHHHVLPPVISALYRSNAKLTMDKKDPLLTDTLQDVLD